MYRNDVLLYFAYGSNLSTPRLRRRVPSVRKLGVATLAMHRLVFHKLGRDGSAKCDALLTGREEDVVHGVVYEMPLPERAALDAAEGLGQGYEIRTVTVVLEGGKPVDAFSYHATLIDPEVLPYDWYREHVLRGTREHGLPDACISALDAIAVWPDPDRTRHAREMSVYRCARDEPQR